MVYPSNRQHFAIFFAAPATRGMVKGTVIWPPPGPRTHSKYDCDDATPYRNLRAVKLGPRGGVWEQTYVEVIGPPVETVRAGPLHCWLCNDELNAHQRQWTRPGWHRRVTWRERKPRLPDDLLEEDRRAMAEGDLRASMRVQRCRIRNMARTLHTYTKPEQPSQLDMTIYSCPNGCDADDALQPLLDQVDHTGPVRAPSCSARG